MCWVMTAASQLTHAAAMRHTTWHWSVDLVSLCFDTSAFVIKCQFWQYSTLLGLSAFNVAVLPFSVHCAVFVNTPLYCNFVKGNVMTMDAIQSLHSSPSIIIWNMVDHGPPSATDVPTTCAELCRRPNEMWLLEKVPRDPFVLAKYFWSKVMK